MQYGFTRRQAYSRPFSPAENSGLRVWLPHSTSFPGSQNNIRRDVKSSCDIPRSCDRL